MRDTKLINAYVVKQNKDKKQRELFKVLKKEVETGANGTQNYIIKKGINKNTIAKKYKRGSVNFPHIGNNRAPLREPFFWRHLYQNFKSSVSSV